MKKLLGILVLILFNLQNSSTAEIIQSTGKYYALVIGNNNYEHFKKLDAAVNDAKVLAGVLENNYGFEVTLLINADHKTTIDSMYATSRKLTKDDNLLIFYAGHGKIDKKENRGYWLPVDASIESRSKWISSAFITDQIRVTDAKHVLLIVDTCYGGIFDGRKMQNGFMSVKDFRLTIDDKYIEDVINNRKNKKYMEYKYKKKSREVFASGGMQPVLDSDGNIHSPFSEMLINILKENKSVIGIIEVFEKVRLHVVSNYEQLPVYGHLFYGADGEFLFFAKN